MREIKFRAWIPQAKEWIENVDFKDLWQSGRAFEDHGTSRYEAENIQGIGWKFDDLIFVEFTGLFDRLKVGICEGDIVRAENVSIGVIERSGAEFIIRTEKDRIGLNDMAPEYVEIIGNLYENPELVTPQAH